MEFWTVIVIAMHVTNVLLFLFMKRRAKRALSVFPTLPPEEVRFHEKYASGRSLKRLGGASNTLDVVVTGEELWIRLSWPISLISSGAEQDLMHKIQLNRLTSVKPQQNWTGRYVEIQFADDSNEIHTLDLRLRQYDEFLAVVPPHFNPGASSLLRPAENANDDETLLIPISSTQPSPPDALLRPDGNEDPKPEE